MAVAFPAPQPVDPVEVYINYFFDRVVACAQHRRATLLTVAQEKRQEIAARVTEREHSEQQLLSARADIERHLRENLLQETQTRILAEIEHKLKVLSAPVPDMYLVFRGKCEQLEQLIGGVGEIYVEAEPVVPRYRNMRLAVAIPKKDTEDIDDEIPDATPTPTEFSVRAIFDYTAAEEGEISFDSGDIMTNVDPIDEGWWQGTAPNGDYGLFPATHVESV